MILLYSTTQRWLFWKRNLFYCSRREAIIVNVCGFFLQNFRLTVLTFRVTFTPLTFCVSRDLKFSLKHNFKQLNSVGTQFNSKSQMKSASKLVPFFTLNLNSGIC